MKSLHGGTPPDNKLEGKVNEAMKLATDVVWTEWHGSGSIVHYSWS